MPVVAFEYRARRLEEVRRVDLLATLPIGHSERKKASALMGKQVKYVSILYWGG